MNVSRLAKQTAYIVAALAVLALILAYMSGAFHSKLSPEKLVPEKRMLDGRPTDLVHKTIQTERVMVAGTLRAKRRTEVSSRIMAAIVEMRARPGDRVEKDDILVRLDDRDLQAGLELARQGEAATKAALDTAQKEFDRAKKLFEEKVFSRQELDRRESTYKVEQARMLQANETKSAAETALSYAIIRAPAGGVVIEKLADAGDTTTPGRPLLTIYDPAELRLEAAVPQALASPLKKGDILEIQIDGIDSSSPIQGAIEEIVPQAEAASRSVLIKARIPVSIAGAAGDALIPGLFGRLFIPDRDRVRLCVPLSAVREVGQLRFVDVVRKDNSLERRLTRLGEHSRMGRIESLSGLAGDERVVLYGPPPEPLPEGVELFPSGADEQ